MEEVRRDAGPQHGQSIGVIAAGNHRIRGNRGSLVIRKSDALKITVAQVAQRVAGGAGLLIDLEAALQGGAVEGAERSLEAPALRVRRPRGLVRREKRHAAQGEHGEKRAGEAAHHEVSIPRVPGSVVTDGQAPDAGPPSLGEAGTGKGVGVSIAPISGRTMRKKRKYSSVNSRSSSSQPVVVGCAPAQPSRMTRTMKAQKRRAEDRAIAGTARRRGVEPGQREEHGPGGEHQHDGDEAILRAARDRVERQEIPFRHDVAGERPRDWPG